MPMNAMILKPAVFLLPALAFGLAAAPAHAQLVLNLTPLAQSGAAGNTLFFSGTLNNPTPSEIFLNGDGFTFSAPAAGLVLDDSPFQDNAPSSLFAMDSGSDTYSGQFFSIFVDPSALPGTYQGTFTVAGGADGNAQATVASTPFFVTVLPSNAPVPEASSLISCGLLLSLGGMATAMRRRKVRIAG